MRRSSDVVLDEPTLADDRLRKAPASVRCVLQRVVAEIQDGLRHGYFEFRLTCEVIGQERRRLTLHAGKSYQYVLRKEECFPAIQSPIDSCDGSDAPHFDLDAPHRRHDEHATGSVQPQGRARAPHVQ